MIIRLEIGAIYKGWNFYSLCSILYSPRITPMFVNLLKSGWKIRHYYERKNFSSKLCEWWWLWKSHSWNGESQQSPTNSSIPLLGLPSLHMTVEPHPPTTSTLQGEHDHLSIQKSVGGMFYNNRPVPTREYIVITRWLCVTENVLGQNSASAPWLAPTGDIYELFTSCSHKGF